MDDGCIESGCHIVVVVVGRYDLKFEICFFSFLIKNTKR